MTTWEYGRLVRSLVAAHEGGPTVAPTHHWEERWYGPDGAAGDPTPADSGIATLNAVGADGWELVICSEDTQIFEDGKTKVIEIRYTFKRMIVG